MKLLANENFPLKSMYFLAEKGYDIIHIGLEFPSVSDEEVIEIAIKQNRIILTFDSDYGTLVFQKGYKPLGVIYLRFKQFEPIFPGDYLYTLFLSRLYSFENQFTVIDELSIRQRIISQKS